MGVNMHFSALGDLQSESYSFIQLIICLIDPFCIMQSLSFFQAIYQALKVLVAVKLDFNFSLGPGFFDQNFGAEMAG